MPQPSNNTINFYDGNAKEFYEQTVSIEMGHLYTPFLELVPSGHTLDAGCGSGRDSLYFLQRGYKVTSLDASKELAELASRLTGQQVLNLRLEDIEFDSVFDGIWACASLLHVDRGDIDSVLSRLNRALKPGGIMFASFKLRDGEWEHNGRYFNGYDMASFEELVRRHPDLSAVSIWKSEDVRPDRRGEQWLNALLRRLVAG